MNILMLDNEFPPLGGGMGTVNLELLKQFRKIPDIKISLITSALGGKREIEPFAEHIILYKVPVWNRNIHHSSNFELILFAIQAFFLAIHLIKRHHYDHCLSWSTIPAGTVAWLLNRIYKIPYLVWISGPDIPGFERRYDWLYPWLTPLIRQVWRSASVVIVKCREEAEMIHTITPDLLLEKIPNGADLSGFIPREPNTDTTSLKVICVARLIQRKGQHHLLQATRQLIAEGINIQVELVGTGDSLTEYRRLARDLSIEKSVHFCGYVPREQISDYYSKADVFVLPSYNEGMSLAALEALASGLPLVLTKTGGAGDLVDPGVNGFLVDWGDVDALANALRKFYRNPCLMQDMGRVSRLRAQQYSWPAIANHFLQIFSNLDTNSSQILPELL